MRAITTFLEIDLSSEQGRALLSSVADRHGSGIAQAATLVSRMFLLRSPWAPGLRFVGAETKVRAAAGGEVADIVFSLSGAGETLDDAVVCCIGEGVDRLAQIECPGDVAMVASLPDVEGRVLPSVTAAIDQDLVDQALPRATPLAWTESRVLGIEAGANVLLPADWCLRRADSRICLRPRTALSVGVAAGPDFEWAAQRAVLELIERDAASLWWIGGRRARSVALDHPGMSEIVRLLAALRQDARDRQTWLLDITTDIGIPALAAVSCGTDGYQFACGLAARPTVAEAARAAILELCQMELAILLAETKLMQAGEGSLGAIDRGHLERAKRINAKACELLHPLGGPLAHPAHRGTYSAVDCALTRGGIELALVDLTREDAGIPVIRAVAPALQPMPSHAVTARLQGALCEFGGGHRYNQGLELV